MVDSFLKLQEMCSFSQNVCIEAYGIFITRLTPSRPGIMDETVLHTVAVTDKNAIMSRCVYNIPCKNSVILIVVCVFFFHVGQTLILSRDLGK